MVLTALLVEYNGRGGGVVFLAETALDIDKNISQRAVAVDDDVFRVHGVRMHLQALLVCVHLDLRNLRRLSAERNLSGNISRVSTHDRHRQQRHE